MSPLESWSLIVLMSALVIAGTAIILQVTGSIEDRQRERDRADGRD